MEGERRWAHGRGPTVVSTAGFEARASAWSSRRPLWLWSNGMTPGRHPGDVGSIPAGRTQIDTLGEGFTRGLLSRAVLVRLQAGVRSDSSWWRGPLRPPSLGMERNCTLEAPAPSWA